MGTATVENHLAAADVKPSPQHLEGAQCRTGAEEAGEDTGVHGQAEEELAERGGGADETGTRAHAAGDSRGYGLDTH